MVDLALSTLTTKVAQGSISYTLVYILPYDLICFYFHSRAFYLYLSHSKKVHILIFFYHLCFP
ncbi:hypothetical protein THOG11_50287 [Vibrio harveyi]|nr:hypothetical protein TH15OA1_480242 [Vibrio harveyi]CAH1571421.1 hypothetical protein THOD03_40282 [Vibrio harveyi]CAH1581561.1 hypothetical protein THOG11_50287 [Vibrio harveyi]